MSKAKGFMGLRKRYCYNCGDPLDYKWFMRNQEFSENQKRKLWNNDMIELFCCSCYNAFMGKGKIGTPRVIKRKLEQLFDIKYPKKELTLKDKIQKENPLNYKTLENW